MIQEETKTEAQTSIEPAIAVDTCSSSCHRSSYRLSFLLPFGVVAALYAPEAIQAQNCGFATIPAVLAGATGLGLYRLCKILKHRK